MDYSDALLENFSNYNTYEYSYEDQTDLDAYDIQNIVINSVLLYIGLCTNIWMFWSLFKTRQAGSRAHFYLLALGITQTLGLIFYCSMEIGLRVTFSWNGGHYGCKVLMALLEFTTLGNLIIVGFNVDNVITLARARPSKVLRRVILVLAILCTLSLAIQQGIWSSTIESGPGFNSSRIWCVRPNMIMLSPLITMGLPIVAILLFGGPSLCVWCARKNTITNRAEKADESNDEAKYIGRDFGLVIALDVLFLLCWTPLLVYFVLGGYYGPTVLFHVILSSLATANSCLNPLVYAVCNCLAKRQNRVSPGL